MGQTSTARRKAAREPAIVREAIKALHAALDRVEPGTPAADAYRSALARREAELDAIEQGGR